MKAPEHPVFFAACVGGALGLFVAIVLTTISRFYYAFSETPLFFAFWPTSFTGIAITGSGAGAFFEVAIFMYVGNAMLYAFVASILVWLYMKIREFLNPDSEKPISIFGNHLASISLNNDIGIGGPHGSQ